MKTKPNLVGFSGELVSMLSLILIKFPKSANSNHENLPNKIFNRFNKPNSMKVSCNLNLKAQVLE